MTKLNSSLRTAYLLPAGIFVIYLLLAAWGISTHELWGDEIHAWNIARSSRSVTELLGYIRYEGHPPLWHLLLFAVTRYTHDPLYMQVLHFLPASITVWLILFKSPFTGITKLLLPFGYYFLYEYAVISRNYALSVLLVLLLLLVIRRKDVLSAFLYFLLLVLLSFTHIYGIFLAISLHLYYLMLQYEQKKAWLIPALGGGLLLLPAIWFVFPPSDGETNLNFFLGRWEFSQFMISIQAPLRSFMPLPAWSEFHSWNTQFLLQWQQDMRWLKFISPVIAAGIILLALRTLIDDKKSWYLFVCNLVLNLVFSIVIFPMSSGRYSGFIFIGWITALWLMWMVKQPDSTSGAIISFFLVVQILAAAISLTKDINRPFSRLPEIKLLMNEVPDNIPLVTDYWTMNAVSAFTGSSIYCIDLQKQAVFFAWNAAFAAMHQRQHIYDTGMSTFFQQTNTREVFLISKNSPLLLQKQDSVFIQHYKPELIRSLEGSIEKSSDLFLYKIRKP